MILNIKIMNNGKNVFKLKWPDFLGLKQLKDYNNIPLEYNMFMIK